MPTFDESLLEPAFDESLLVPETRPERGQRLRTELVAARQEPAALSDPNAPPPSPISTFQGASEVALMPPGEQYRQFQLPRFGPTPGVPQPVTTFQGPSEVTLAPESVARRTGEILQSAAASGVEGIVNPMTPPLILGAMAAPEVAIPLLTATMAKSGATELGEGLVDLQQGREAEGIAKVGGGGTALMFAALPALHPGPFAGKPQAGSVFERAGEAIGRGAAAFLPRARAALAEEPTPTTEPAPPGEPGAPQPAPVTEVPSAIQVQEAGTPVRDVPQQPVVSEGKVPAAEGAARVPPGEQAAQEPALPLTPAEQAAARAQLAEEVPAAQPVEAPMAVADEAAALAAYEKAVTASSEGRWRSAQNAAYYGRLANITPERVVTDLRAKGYSDSDIADFMAERAGGRGGHGRLEATVAMSKLGAGTPVEAPAPAEAPAELYRRRAALLKETSEEMGAATITREDAERLGHPEYAGQVPYDATQTKARQELQEVNAKLSDYEAARLRRELGREPTPQEMERALAQGEQAATPAPEAPKPAPARYPNTGVGTPADEFGAIYGPTLTPAMQTRFQEQVGESFDLPSTLGTTTTLKVKPHMLWMEVNRRVPGAANVYETGVAYMNVRSNGETVLDASKHGRDIDKQAAQALLDFLGKTQGEKPATATPPAELPAPAPVAKPAPTTEPPAPPAGVAPGPALTLLGLTEDKFALPSLRKLSRDTLRRLANSLGTEATVPAIARRAAERFDEMRQQPLGPVGMGGALAAEMSGTDAPLAGTPAHAVETGPPSERPLGLTDPASAPFVSLSLEMLGQRSSVSPEFSVQTGLNALAGSSAPRLTAMNRPAGEALVRYASSKIAAPYKALVFSSRVLETGVNVRKWGTALTEDNLRSVEQEFLRQANEAFEAGDQPAADAAYEKALNVRSTIGGKNSPFRTEEDYQNFLADPITQASVARHVQLWQEQIEPQFKMAQSLDPDIELPTRGQQTGARINLKVVLEGDEPGTSPVTASRGGLTASFKRNSPFAREAKGTGDVYESNYPDIIANTYRRQLEIANQNEMNRILVANDLARIDKPGARVMFGDKPGVPFPLTRRLILTGGEAIPAGQNIYVRPEFAREYRTALNTDAPQRIPFFTEASGLFTRASIAGLGELTTHISNLAIGLFTRPNSPLLLDSIAKATGSANAPIAIVRALIKAAADNREQVAQLAEIGVVREPPGRPAKSQYPLINAVNMVRGAPRRLIHWADTTIRLTLDDAYKGLVKEGIGENTETERREFINQVGQYNKRLQGQFTVLLRDTGIGPFVTAGKTFNVMGIRNMLLSPGLKATSPMAAAALRANALAGWVGFVTLAATLNWVLTRNKGGGVMGRPGVPTGNIDTGTDDEQGRPISLPLADALGYGRGLRITGARRLIEAKRYGIDQNQALDSALGDVVNAAVGPALGPIVRTGFAAVTGRPPALNVGRTAPVVGPEQSQFAANVLDALRRANPLVNAAYDVREGKSGLEVARSQAQRFSPQPGMTESKAEAMPRIIERARLNEYIDDLARRARRLPLAERAAFIRDEMEKAELSGAERVRVHRQIQGRIRYP